MMQRCNRQHRHRIVAFTYLILSCDLCAGFRVEPAFPSHNAVELTNKMQSVDRLSPSSRPPSTVRANSSSRIVRRSKTSATADDTANVNKAKPRTGLAHAALDFLLASPFWRSIMVPQARATMVRTAEANGIEWTKASRWFRSRPGPWTDDEDPVPRFLPGDDDDDDASSSSSSYGALSWPDYYTKEFHAYERGNLCWDAAIESEIASRAVGARNFPAFGADGEEAFRSAFERASADLGAAVPDDGVIVDLGCGTGASTRRLGRLFPRARRIVGLDLSPHMVEVGRTLLQLAPSTSTGWVNDVERDDRIELCVGNAESVNLPDASVDAVSLSFVIHELPVSASRNVLREASRILRPGGQLWISEMDFDSPAYAAQRENALLFSLLRSTEPFLDDYADGCEELRELLVDEFERVRITAATGRHYSLVATKGDGGLKEFVDTRFKADGSYALDDTHLQLWESKE